MSEDLDIQVDIQVTITVEGHEIGPMQILDNAPEEIRWAAEVIRRRTIEDTLAANQGG